MLRSLNQVFTRWSIFDKNYGNMGFYGNQNRRYGTNLPVKTVLLTFQMEQNGTFLDNFKYDYWILHKKLP